MYVKGVVYNSLYYPALKSREWEAMREIKSRKEILTKFMENADKGSDQYHYW